MHNSKIALIFIFFICLQYTAVAQNDTIWYDKEWNETSKFHAEFFRPKPKKKKGKYVIKDYYLNGKLQMEGPSIEQDTTIFDGEVTHYYKTGIMQSSTFFKNGILDGHATEFFEDGVIKRVIPYDNGIQNGVYKEYYPNGQLNGTIEFKNDVRDGFYVEYYDNGNKKAQITFSQGEKDGKFLEFYSDGSIKNSAFFENGILQGETKMYDADGQLKNSGSFLDNQKHGVWKTVGYENTVVSRTYNKEILHGEINFEMQRTENSIEHDYKGHGMYENGILKSWTLKRKYKSEYVLYRVMSLENGKILWKNYDDNGKVISDVSYGENNIEDGNWKFYYPNGKVMHDITFVAKDCYNKAYEIEEEVIESVDHHAYNDANGSPGIPSAYLPDGLNKQEDFDFYYECEASAQGMYTHFYKNGKPKLKATFKDGNLIGNIEFYNKKKTKTVINVVDDVSKMGSLINIIPIKIDSQIKVDYSIIEPDPFEIIFYYEDSYGTTDIRKAIVHPILKTYISKLPTDSTLFSKLVDELNKIEGINVQKHRFSTSLYYSLETYKTHSYEDY